MSRPFSPRGPSSGSPFIRINGKIRAREVRVIGGDGHQLGVMSLNDALNLARKEGVDLVEIAATAQPPVCKVVDYGKYRYELAKKDKESKKHHQAGKVKEIQLSANIDPHDFGVKFAHAVDFLCEDMKVKLALRFRGREMAHTEFGFQVVNKFITNAAPWAHPDATPKLVGKSINVMLSPLPRNKRAKHPGEGQVQVNHAPAPNPAATPGAAHSHAAPAGAATESKAPAATPKPAAPQKPAGFANNPFSNLDVGNLEKGASPGDAAAA